jgi:hypothetical protein
MYNNLHCPFEDLPIQPVEEMGGESLEMPLHSAVPKHHVPSSNPLLIALASNA